MGCHCLCNTNHPTVSGCCTGISSTTVPFGNIEVKMCANCAAATEASARAGLLRADEIREPTR